jgi:outer membrane protein TolC
MKILLFIEEENMLRRSDISSIRFLKKGYTAANHIRFAKLLSWCIILLFSISTFLSAAPHHKNNVIPSPANLNQPEENQILKLSLMNAIEMALKENLDIKIESFNTSITENQIKEAKGFFDLQGFFYASYNKDISKPYSIISTGILDIDTANIVRGGIEQNIPTGGNYRVQFQNMRSASNSPFVLFNPRYIPVLSLQVTQSLLKGRGVEVSKKNIYIAQNNHKISRHQFALRVMEILSNVHQLYFNLIFTIEDLKVKQGSLKLAQDQLEITRTKVEVGTLAPIEIAQAEAAVARREAEIISAESAVKAAQDQLIKAISSKTDYDSWKIKIEPTEKLTFETKAYDLDNCLETAMKNRPELAQAELNINNKKLNVNFAKNQKLPQVDLTGSLSFDGLDGDKPIIEGNIFTGEREVVGVIPGGLGGALEELFSLDYRDWTIGVNVTIPIQNKQFEGAYARSKVELEQEKNRYKNTMQNIILQVKDAVRAIETNKKMVNATKKARELAEKQLEAEQKKFAVGTSTNFQVLQMQEDLAAALTEEKRAIIDYNVSLFNLKRILGTLLDDMNINLET